MAFDEQLADLNEAIDATLATAAELAAEHTPAVGPVQEGLAVIAIDPFEGEGAALASKLLVSATAAAFTTAPAKGDGLTLGGVDYLIRDIDADQGGRLQLTLERDG